MGDCGAEEKRGATLSRHRTPLARAGGIVGAVIAAVGALASHAGAGTIRHDRADQLYRDLAAQPQFAPVGSYSSSLYGSLTLIHPQWALTAAHVVDTDWDGRIDDESMGTVRIAGQTRTATQLVVPTGVNGNPGWNGNIGNGFDIALVRLSSPVNITPAAIYTGFQELGKTITMVGYGRSGTGKTGSTTGTGIKRAGQNVVDEMFRFPNGLSGLRWDFDEPSPRLSPNRLGGSSVPLDLEYQIAPGDSGGGSFLFEKGQWYLAGVHSGTYDYYTYPGTDDSHTYGDLSLVTRVAAYREFIASNIPELAAIIPEPGHLSLLALAGLLACRRPKRSAK